MKKINNVNRLSGYEEMPYFRTHPLSSERLRFFEEHTKQSSGQSVSPLENRFQLVKAKLSAFLLPPDRVARLYPESDRSQPALYARAVTAYKQAQVNQAVTLLDSLLTQSPDNPYFYELKGQFLFESGRLKEALAPYEKAHALQPEAYGILIGWAQTILESPHSADDLNRVIVALNKKTISRPTPTGWLLLARAYDENGRKAEALYAAARYSLAIGNKDAARRQIEEAEKQHPSSTLALKIKDLKQSPDFAQKQD
jgi:predicted Zn-dependent protease